MDASTASASAMYGLCVRMVVPMRREFDMAIDVARLMKDASYARTIVATAATSGDERLRRYAVQLAAARGERPRTRRAARERSAPAPAPVSAPPGVLARALLDTVGPHGEPLAIRIERAPDAAHLATLLAEARALVASMRGTQAARVFEERVRQANAEDDSDDHAASGRIDVRRHAARAAQRLTTLLGPHAEALVLELHAARNARELVRLIRKARDTVASLLGEPIAAGYLSDVLTARQD